MSYLAPGQSPKQWRRFEPMMFVCGPPPSGSAGAKRRGWVIAPNPFACLHTRTDNRCLHTTPLPSRCADPNPVHPGAHPQRALGNPTWVLNDHDRAAKTCKVPLILTLTLPLTLILTLALPLTLNLTLILALPLPLTLTLTLTLALTLTLHRMSSKP